MLAAFQYSNKHKLWYAEELPNTKFKKKIYGSQNFNGNGHIRVTGVGVMKKIVADFGKRKILIGV